MLFQPFFLTLIFGWGSSIEQTITIIQTPYSQQEEIRS